MSTIESMVDLDPVIEALRRHDEGLKADRLRLKYELMSEDMFSFFRGGDPLFAAAWATMKPLEAGPKLLICGDLHLENFGAYRTDEGEFVFDINDFDEAAVAPCSYDLVRCSTSILLAAQVWKLSPIQAMRMVLGFLDRYWLTISEAISGDLPGISNQDRPVDDLLNWCALGTQAELLTHLTRIDKSGDRTIKRDPDRTPGLSKSKVKMVSSSVEEYGRSKGRPEAFKVLDATGRIAGIGSLGVRRYVVLVSGDGTPEGNRLLDIKQTTPSSLSGLVSSSNPSTWANDAERVVDAQRKLQAKPTSGLDVLNVDGQAYRVRELIPVENRAKLDLYRHKPSRLRKAVEVAGRITAWSHLRAAKIGPDDQTQALADWAAGPALEAVLAAAVRFADRTRSDFKTFRRVRASMQS